VNSASPQIDHGVLPIAAQICAIRKTEMTKRTTKITTALSLALIVFAGLNCFAAANPVVFNGAGSSGMFNLAALAADQTTGCGTNIWTQKNGASGIDSRRSDIPAQTGNVWIVWNNNVTTICAYLSVDSVVGNILFFAQPVATLSIPSSAVGAAGNNLIPTLTDVPLPQSVYNALNNQPFNAAMTDIRSEDALFAVNRALAPWSNDSHCTGLGYTGDGLVGVPILSSQSSKSATPVAFSISGKDPFNGAPIPTWTSIPIGAEPVIVFANTTSGSDFASANYTNVDRFVLTELVNGTLTRTRDIANVAGLPSNGTKVFLREPTSGTYNTFEFTVPGSVEAASCQELNVNPSTDNPLNISYPTGGTRERVVGTGEMVSTVAANANGIGYAFWSTGNFAKVLTSTKYLSVDGVDPLNYSWYQSRGAFPNCVAPCPGLIPFVNILNGSYPAWTILRVSCYTKNGACPPGVTSLVTAAQKEFSKVPDILPVSNLQVFRSHFDRPEELAPASNGNAGEPPEAGGDVGGAVFTKNADGDFHTDTGLQFTNIKQ
jgi:ABC-type phosphate transport system substrate-binding protein